MPAREPGIHPHAGTCGSRDVEHGAAGGQESAGGILRVHAGLDRVAGHRDVVLRERQLLPRGDADLQLDQVEAGDHLGDRMFDLQAGVHLHEEELVGLGRRRR